MSKKLTVASLFSGAGGMDIGFSNAGFEVVWATDFDKDACETYHRWSGLKPVCADISELDISTIPDIDVIVGGFPCQGFSMAGNRNVDDSRNLLYKNFVECVSKKKPLAFVAENVSGLLTIGGSNEIAKRIMAAFSREGYSVNWVVLKASRMGVPQDRKRLIIVGIRSDVDVFPTLPVHDDVITTMRMVLWGLDKPEHDDIFWGSFSSQFMSRNRVRGWDEPSFTVIATSCQTPLHPSSPPMVRIGKEKWEFGEGETRRMSWREAALIQTFPASLEFSGNISSKHRQIGNAVPCKLAERVARCLLSDLSGHGEIR